MNDNQTETAKYVEFFNIYHFYFILLYFINTIGS